MHYSFTEKKRIRKSFAKRANVHNVPFLLATQLESYLAFLQADRASHSVKMKVCSLPSRPYFLSFRTMVLRVSNFCPTYWVTRLLT